MILSIDRFKQEDNSKWNEFLPFTRNELFLFNRSYMDYHAHRFTDHSLFVYKNEKLIALFPANENENNIYSHAGLTYGGLLSSPALTANDTLQVFTLIIDYYANLGFREIYYKSIPYIFSKYPCQEDLYALSRHNALLYRRDISSVIDLSDPHVFSDTKERAFKKCTQQGVIITEQDDFFEYWELLTSVLEKFQVKPVHSLDEISLLKDNFKGKIRLFEARLDGELLAGTVIYDYNMVVHTQYLANSVRGRSMGALDFILAHLVTKEFSKRKYFSYGISTEQDGRVLNEGLIFQKESMGGRAVVNDFYKILLK